MRVIVCGGRDYWDARTVYRTLDNLGVTEVAQGGASGADALAFWWARKREVECQTFKAEWKVYGKAAGPRRNAQMLETFRPDAVVAFDGGSGTADMVRKATEAGVRVIRVAPDPTFVNTRKEQHVERVGL